MRKHHKTRNSFDCFFGIIHSIPFILVSETVWDQVRPPSSNHTQSHHSSLLFVFGVLQRQGAKPHPDTVDCLVEMAAASSSADPVDVARNQGEGGAREHNRQDTNTDVSNLPGNVESLIHLDGTARQIEIQIRGHPEHWSNRTFVFIMVVGSLSA